MTASEALATIVSLIEWHKQNPGMIRIKEVTTDPTPDMVVLDRATATEFYRMVAFFDIEWNKSSELAEKADKNGVKRTWRKPSANMPSPPPARESNWRRENGEILMCHRILAAAGAGRCLLR